MTDSANSSEMTTDYPRAVKVEVLDRAVKVWLWDGRTLTVPLEWYPMLCDGTPAERDNWELIGDGVAIHWPDLDEDIGVDAMLAGVPCTYNARTLGRWLLARREGRGVTAREIDAHEQVHAAEAV